MTSCSSPPPWPLTGSYLCVEKSGGISPSCIFGKIKAIFLLLLFAPTEVHLSFSLLHHITEYLEVQWYVCKYCVNGTCQCLYLSGGTAELPCCFYAFCLHGWLSVVVLLLMWIAETSLLGWGGSWGVCAVCVSPPWDGVLSVFSISCFLPRPSKLISLFWT